MMMERGSSFELRRNSERTIHFAHFQTLYYSTLLLKGSFIVLGAIED